MDDIRRGRCPLCGHQQIIEAPAMDLNSELVWGNAMKGQAIFRGSVTFTLGPAGRVRGHGSITHYVCRGCGYLQSFAESPQSIPIDEAHKTRLLDGGAPEGPYR